MIANIQGLPDYVAGFSASGTVTREDYERIVLPVLDNAVRTHGHIHFLLVLKTAVENYTPGAWMLDAMAGIKHFSKWKKMAIVSDQLTVKKITDLVSPLIPGHSRGFSLSEEAEARRWVASED